MSAVASLIIAGVFWLPSAPAGARSSTGAAAPTSDQDGYAWISYYRGLAGLPAVRRDAGFEVAEALHVRYLADHSQRCETDVHTELTRPAPGCPANPYATAAGRTAALNSNITRVDGPVSDRQAVTNWFVSAFHALTLLEPRLVETGYAAYYTPDPSGARPQAYRFTAAVDVYRGRTGSYTGQRLAFPGDGSTSPLLSYQVGTESPEPFADALPDTTCHGWATKAEVSAPIVLQWPVGSHPVQTGATIRDLSSGTDLPTCSLTAAQYPAGSVARQLLLGTNRLTQAGLYFAAIPFVAGHRYRLTIAGTAVTTFSTTASPRGTS